MLDKKGGRILVISKYALDCKTYNKNYDGVTWESCSLRAWLNDDFINTAFSKEEKAAIPTVTVSADRNPKYSTNPAFVISDGVVSENGVYVSLDYDAVRPALWIDLNS